MENENYDLPKRLDRVFDALKFSNHDIKDDTLPEKFIQWFHRRMNSRDSCHKLLNATSFVSFLQSTVQTLGQGEEEVEVQRLVIALQLAGHIGSYCLKELESTQNEYVLSSVFGSVDVYWSHPTVRNAWVTGLHLVSTHTEGLEWIIEKGYYKKTLGCYEDSSIFVSTAERKFLVHCLCLALKSEACIENVEPGLQWWSETLQRCVGTFIQETPSVTQLKTLVELLEEISSHGKEGNTLLQIILSKFTVVDKVCQMMTEEWERSEMVTVCDLAIRLFNITWSKNNVITDGNKNKVLLLPSNLLSRGHIAVALKLAAWIIPRSECVVAGEMRNILSSYLNLSENMRNKITQKDGGNDSNSSLFSLAVKLAANLGPETFPDLEHYICNALKLSSQAEACGRKLQPLLLDTLLLMKDVIKYTGIMPTCMALLQASPSTSVVIGKTFRLVSRCLCKISDSALLTQLAENVQRKLCDTKWEVRDSTVEFIGYVIQDNQGNIQIINWVCEHNLHKEAWNSVGDGESYVRASAMKTLGIVTQHEGVWKDLLRHITQEEVIDKVIDICEHDTEAFARRQAVVLLCEWTTKSNFTSKAEQMLKILNSKIKDLDWEIKLLVLQYWEAIIDKEFSKQKQLIPKQETQMYISSTLENLLKKGCLQGLILYGLNDFDQSVQCKACEILTKLKNIIGNYELIISEPLEKKSRKEYYEINVSDFIHTLNSEDLEAIKATSSASTDLYEKNPDSVLDDILTSLNVDDEDNFVDCY